MRLPLIPPAELNAKQRPLYEDMRKGIQASFQGFQAVASNGALIGPWNSWIQFPEFGRPIWDLVKALSNSNVLPKPVREVALLVTGAHFHAGYEIYSHVLVAEKRGISEDKISTIIAGQRPFDLSRQEAIAYDVASALVSGSSLPELCYNHAVDAFGHQATAELIFLVGLYCMIAITLNGFDVPVPEKTIG